MELENKDPTEELVSLPQGFLRSITDDFCAERKLGNGAYGMVYKGILPCGSVIAVKKFHERILAGDDRSFENEASSLMDIEHQNVVQLLGFCAESRGAMVMKQPNGKVIVVEQLTRMLCFEYMSKGGLDKHLSDESSGLEWNTRYKIIKGICHGLNFLHGCGIIHLDLKPENILMDATMTPKIADFGLSRLLAEQKSHTVASTSNRPGTRGYMAREYIDRGIISKKADIFSLGVIIIEILTGSKDDYPDYGKSNEVFQHFTEKVLSNWRKRFQRSSKYTAPELHIQLVKQCINIALECVHPDKEKRPNVSNIIEILNSAEESFYDQNGEDLPVDHQNGTQEGLPTSGVLHEDGLVALNKSALKDYAQAWITKGMISCFDDELVVENGNNLEYRLKIGGRFLSKIKIRGERDTNDGMFWNVLDFHSLSGLKHLRLYSCDFLPLCYLQMLSSLRTLWMSCSSNTFPFVEADNHVKYQFPVEELTILKWNARGMELTQLLTYFPKLSYLVLFECQKQVTGLGVNVRGQLATETPGPSSSANKERPRAEEEIGLLLLPPQLQELWIRNTDLSLHSDPRDNSNCGRTGVGGGLQGLTSLRKLKIQNCPELLSNYSSSSFSSFPFPVSLEDLYIERAIGIDTLVPVSNLTSLTSLSICDCGNLRGEGLLPLLAQGHLTILSVRGMPNFFVDSEHSQVHQKEIPSCSSKLQVLDISDVAGFTAASTRRNMLLSSLTTLEINHGKVDCFTEEQEALLFVNTLQNVTFGSCKNLRYLPKRLHGLRNLKRLYIWFCDTIQMLPKDGLSSSLELLEISGCPKFQSLPKDCLPDSLQKLVIRYCPDIQSLPEVDDLPSSLRELDVRHSGSEELRSQCSKLINIIPIVKA